MFVARLPLVAIAWIGVALVPVTGHATTLPITDNGILEISNLAGSLLGLGANPLCFNWGGGSTCVAGTAHQMEVSGSSNLFSTAPSAGDLIKDLTSLTPIVDFETVTGGGVLIGQTIHFDLNSINANGAAALGNCASNAALNSCTPAFSPFTLSEDILGTQLTISFSASLSAYTGTRASGSNNYRAFFTTQASGNFVGSGACNGIAADITNFLNCQASGGTIDATWSAAESDPPSVPEPSSLFLAGLGLAGLALLRTSRPRFRGVLLAALAAAVLAPVKGFATTLPITDTGILQIANAGGSLLGITALPNPCINWGGGATCVGGTAHQMNVSGSSNLFATNLSISDQIQDLPSISSPVSNFETVLGAGSLAGQSIIFDLTSIPINTGAADGNCTSNAASNSCTPASSPFTLTEDGTGAQLQISFSALLSAHTGTSASGATSYQAIFKTQASGDFVGAGACNGIAANITNFLTCEAAGGTIQGTWSATESPATQSATTTPEPGSITLIASAALALAILHRLLRPAPLLIASEPRTK